MYSDWINHIRNVYVDTCQEMGKTLTPWPLTIIYFNLMTINKAHSKSLQVEPQQILVFRLSDSEIYWW